MIRTAALQLEVFIGEPPELHLMSLYEIDGTKYASFTAEDSEYGVWIPIPTPPIFLINPDIFDDFKKELSCNGYIFRDAVGSRLQ